MANGMMLSCKKAPIKRKNAAPVMAMRRNGTERHSLNVWKIERTKRGVIFLAVPFGGTYGMKSDEIQPMSAMARQTKPAKTKFLSVICVMNEAKKVPIMMAR